MSKNKNIFVYAHWEGFSSPFLTGVLSSVPARGKEVFSFEYTQEWLQSGFNYTLDPDLQFYSGRYFPRDEKLNFGMFMDSCPDRWGRVLMDRKEAVLARKENRAVKHLLESDYLLGVYDGHRMGGLRFKLDESGDFLNNDKDMAAPPWTSLRELEHASIKFEEDDIDDSDYLKWLNLLIAPGSSLGGARPKANVLDANAHPWIAKFPSLKDDKDVGAWEMVTNTLAHQSGLNVAKAETKKFKSKYHTFLSKRFDRNARGERIHFASAMTLLGYSDGAGSDSGASYIELAEFIIQNGSNVDSDLEELWRRIVFSICVKNTDDHLRNHGFLLNNKGWTLSPAYDINPNEYGTGLGLNISEKDNALDLDLALVVAEYFRLKGVKANAIVGKIRKSVSNWQLVAKQLGINKTEQERMSKAFMDNR